MITATNAHEVVYFRPDRLVSLLLCSCARARRYIICGAVARWQRTDLDATLLVPTRMQWVSSLSCLLKLL